MIIHKTLAIARAKRNGGLNLIDLEILEAHVPDNASWIIKAIMQHRDDIHQNQVWLEMLNAPKFSMKKMYMAVYDRAQSVVWRTLFYGNMARPRAPVNLWLACHERLATRDRLHKYGSTDTTRYCFCNADETQQRLMCNCSETKGIWRKILEWIHTN
ncbi:hypothetical protein TSUD_17080 [Trifolium subterraneum]|uniref:Reverse transcriptase zinc-binding domain-containing protein n=1 Tax=Trifolium subterraneum TaxID=3900 RepID=A0A2Z6NFU5_TRISU|nr:hypothetical protein TSUD_17080 [Trifolium subterraneum]